MSSRLPRWTGLLFLPLLIGALLLMHGLDAHASEVVPGASASLAASAAPEAHHHDNPVPASDHHGCVDCLAGHLMAVCAAVITSIATIGLARRLLAGRCLATSVAAVAGRARAVVELVRPPDPAWVRLAVMRC